MRKFIMLTKHNTNHRVLTILFLLLSFLLININVKSIVYASTDYRFVITDTIPSDNDEDIPINIHTGETGERCSIQNNYKVCTVNIGLGISPENPKSGIGYPKIDKSSVNKDTIEISSNDSTKVYPKFNGDQECGDCGDFYHSFFINLVDEDGNEILLKPNTTYTITIKGGDSGLITYYDSSFEKYYAQLNNDYTWSFKTGDDDVPPKISSVSKKTTNTSVKIEWNTNEQAKSRILYGLDTNYEMSKSIDEYRESNSIILTGLEQGKNYKFKIISEDSLGNENYYSSDFTTLGINSIQISSIGENSATITWATNRTTDSYVEYGENTKYGSLEGYDTLSTSHNVVLANLNAGTNYNFRIKASEAGGISYSDNFIFKTIGEKEHTSETDNDAPDKPDGVNLDYNSTNKTIKITWENKDDDIEKVSVYLGYDKDFDKNSDSRIAENSKDDEDVTVEKIEEDKTYYFKLVSEDKAGNKSDTKNVSIYIPKNSDEETQVNTEVTIAEINTPKKSVINETNNNDSDKSDSVLGTSKSENNAENENTENITDITDRKLKFIVISVLAMLVTGVLAYIVKTKGSKNNI